MARYLMDDGTIVDTGKAQQCWEENTWWDGRNHISKATNSQWEHETLYRSRKGRYYIVHTSQWQGTACWVDNDEASMWLFQNDCDDVPEELLELIEAVSE